MDAKTLALQLTELAFDKKAFNLKILQVSELVGYADFLILCSGRSDRQVKAIADHVALTMKKEHSTLPAGTEGLDSGQWALLDYGDVIMHVFNAPVREYYDLDGLWTGAPQLPVETPAWEDDMRENVFERGVVYQP